MDTLGCFHFNSIAPNTILVLQDNILAGLQFHALRNIGVDPDFIFIHHIGQDVIGLCPAE
jgi:hypothetical protein